MVTKWKNAKLEKEGTNLILTGNETTNPDRASSSVNIRRAKKWGK